MSFSRPIQWYHSHADPMLPGGGTFKTEIHCPDADSLSLLASSSLSSGVWSSRSSRTSSQRSNSGESYDSCGRLLILLFLGTRNRLVDVKG